MNSESLDVVIKKAKVLVEICNSFQTHDQFLDLASRLEKSIEFCKTQNTSRPVVVSLIGGTGTGKSFIFSKLCGEKNLSPSSDSIRGFTKTLYISAFEEDRAFLDFDSGATVYVNGVLHGTVLVDSPDIDTISKENFALTQNLIEQSDILIYITTPDKRSNFDIHKTILNWANRKRWFFVMNKCDTATDVSIENLKRDFCEKIRSFGFSFPENNTFLFSAKEEASYEFSRFKDRVFSERSYKQNQLIKEIACYRNFLFSFYQSKSLEAIKIAAKQISDAEEKLLDKLAQSQTEVLKQQDIWDIAINGKKRMVYKILSERRTFFLYPYLFILSIVKPSFSIKDFSLEIGRRILSSKAYKQCIKDESYLLQDLHLENYEAKNVDSNISPIVAPSLENAIKTAAKEIADSKTVSFYLFVANLLPAIILWQALYRAFTCWLTAVWLPSDFFLHALIMVSGATIPGYLLVSHAITRLCVTSKNITVPAINLKPRKLSTIKTRLDEFLRLSNDFCSYLEKLTKSTEKDLPHEQAGLTTDTKLKAND